MGVIYGHPSMDLTDFNYNYLNKLFTLQKSISSLMKIEYISNRTITKFYNSDDVNATTAEPRQTKATPIFFK